MDFFVEKKNLDELQQQIKVGYIKFTETKGGTELGVRITPGGSSGALKGNIFIEEGDLYLASETKRCRIQVDLLDGRGKVTLL